MTCSLAVGGMIGIALGAVVVVVCGLVAGRRERALARRLLETRVLPGPAPTTTELKVG